MKKEISDFLIVEKGEPYQRGAIIPLENPEVTLGRAWEDQQPDIPFSSFFISRRHAAIKKLSNKFFLTDLPSSKKGTKLNERLIEKAIPQELKNGDHIFLADGEVSLIFCTGIKPGDTVVVNDPTKETEILLDEASRKVHLNGQEIDIWENGTI